MVVYHTPERRGSQRRISVTAEKLIALTFPEDIMTTAFNKSNYKWTEEWIDHMPIDHFSFADNRTFRLRYLINTDYFTAHGPIFFYTGNEGNIEGFALNTGFMWDIAADFNAAIVFAEHRYYGESHPFGNESYASVKNLGYLSSEQALADFADLIQFLRNEVRWRN
ncbi:unnamed protein product [Toxocara canis]|uniref:Peptidase_S9 domain-containing protein n=1 Tax=Toxocara canis TaxID=6265 RepID=A0A183V5U0_TOXCA|nr:unnamed protein product [Toxocara canis]